MATKTISIDLEAYQRLVAARRESNESFSKVIKRAVWDGGAKTCGRLLAALPALSCVDDDTLRRLEEAQLSDLPPDDSWA